MKQALILQSMKVVKVTFFILISFLSVQSQSFFKGSAIMGINASQIDGDDLAGYHKYGLSTGLKVEFPLSSVLDLGIEFMLNQTGSRTALINNVFEETYRFHLNYISLPLVVKWNDWWIADKEYYKFNIHGGIANSYLVSSDIEESPVLIDDELNNYNLAWLLGGGFSFTKAWTLSVRYTRSITPMYRKDFGAGLEPRRLLGYFLTLRTEYNF